MRKSLLSYMLTAKVQIYHTSAQSAQDLRYPLTETLDTGEYISWHQICANWFAHFLFALEIKAFFITLWLIFPLKRRTDEEQITTKQKAIYETRHAQRKKIYNKGTALDRSTGETTLKAKLWATLHKSVDFLTNVCTSLRNCYISNR